MKKWEYIALAVLLAAIAFAFVGCSSSPLTEEDRMLVRNCQHQLWRRGVTHIGTDINKMQSAGMYCRSMVMARRAKVRLP